MNVEPIGCAGIAIRTLGYQRRAAVDRHQRQHRIIRVGGFESRPLVSVDYKDDPRSAIIDGLSTMVIDGTSVKILAW